MEEQAGRRVEATIKDFNTVLTRQGKKFFTFELFKVIQDAIPLILRYRSMSLIPDGFFQVHLSRRMCNQFTFHHQPLIDSGRTTFKQGQTDGILYSRESHA